MSRKFSHRLERPQLVLRGYVGERRGEREEMQDAHAILDDLTPLLTNPSAEMFAFCTLSSKYCVCEACTPFPTAPVWPIMACLMVTVELERRTTLLKTSITR